MAKHTDPTLDLLTVEGLILAGYPNETAGSTNQLRAESWVQEMYADIRYMLGGRELKPLMVTSYALTTAGVSRYAMPSDLSSWFSIAILDSTVTGTATAGGNTSITIATTISSTDYGKLILITGGTGAGSCSQIVTNSGTTVTVSPAWTTNPANASTYMIVDKQYKLQEGTIETRDDEFNPYGKATPTHYFPIGQGNADADETGEFELFPVPDKVYGLQLRYFMNLNLADLTNDANLLLTVYRRWQSIIIQKVMYKMLKSDKDERAKEEEARYWDMLKMMIAKDAFEADMSNLQYVVQS